MFLALFLLVSSPALAAPIDEAGARALAIRFYALTGRPPVEEAFLADDIAALVETGRDAEVLETAVVRIAQTVPGADRYTLAGILESHLAAALGEEEEVNRPPPPQNVLGEVQAPVRFEPSAALVQELLDAYYAGVGRAPPSPPREADLLAIAALTRAGWTEAGLRQLVAWVPGNVHGAEMLGFAEAAALASSDKGYLGGPRSTGELETLRGLSRRPPPEPLWGEKDPWAFDGGQLSGFTTMNALPSAVDLDAARLPGQSVRWLEGTARGDSDGTLPGGNLLVGQAAARWGFVAEGGVMGHPSGARSRDRFGPDGGLPLATDAAMGRATYGRFTLGVGGPVPIGGQVWGVSGPNTAGAGASASLLWGAKRPLSVVTLVGAGTLGQPRQGQDTAGILLVGELGPSWQSGDWFAEGRLRVGFTSGGLVNDAFPVVQDSYGAGTAQGLVRAGQRTERSSWGMGLAVEGQGWTLSWQENDRVDVEEFGLNGGGGEVEVFGGVRYGVRESLWLSGGARVFAGWGEAQATAMEGALGVQWLLWEKAWLSAAARAGDGAELDLGVALPF